MTHFQLPNNTTISAPGYGTYLLEKSIAAQCVATAIDIGYRHIDAAAIYKNEPEVGRGIRESGVSRNELFITSKLWNTERGYDTTLRAFEKTCQDLQVEYLDLYLIHWPANAKQFNHWQSLNSETWRAFETLYRQGTIKVIGLSNFLPHHIDSLLEKAEVPPMVNQLEYHPGYQQRALIDFCKKQDILVQGWGAIGQARILDNPTLKEVAGKYGKTVAQLCIRWAIQNGTVPIVKSSTESRIRENFEVVDFTIANEDMAIIDGLPPQGGTGLDPDQVDF